MDELTKVKPGDIVLGKPLPHSIYDGNGVLLLKAGFTINLRRQLDRLMENGLFMANDTVEPTRSSMQADEQEAQNSFEMLDMLKIQLKNLFGHLKNGKAQDFFIRQIAGISLNMQEACTHDTDAALANLQLDYQTPYVVVHSLQAAMICELVGKKLGVPEESRLTTINAALTQCLGLLDIQDTLDRQTTPLTSEQKACIHAHPLNGVAMLKSLGVTDQTWLDAIAQHHERIDGSGYPNKLTGDSIKIPARLLAVADTYSAMVRDRPYRKAMFSKVAMRNLLVEQGSKIDQRLIEMMVKVIGIFPPGAIVKLANGEVGVVKKRQENSASPIVFAFAWPNDMPKVKPIQRNTEEAEFGIVGLLNFSNYKGYLALIRGLWINN